MVNLIYTSKGTFNSPKFFTETVDILTFHESIFLSQIPKAHEHICGFFYAEFHPKAFGELVSESQNSRFCNCQLGDFFTIWYNYTILCTTVHQGMSPKKNCHTSVCKVCNVGGEEMSCSGLCCRDSMGAEIQANFLLQSCTKSSLTSSHVSTGKIA